MERIAVVGSGISGLAAAWLLARRYRVTLFEAAPRLGGHSHTVDVSLEGQRFPVDTGFLVFNHHTYPHLTALFETLGVEVVESEMTFSVSLAEPRLEWAGSSLATLFAQRRNLARPQFWAMLQDILRFNRETTRLAKQGASVPWSLQEYLDIEGYGRPFRDWYLLPMAAAIWSCPTGQMLDYPLATFVRFCHNHGLLQIFDRPQWLTVRGGSREYVQRIAQALEDVRLATPVIGLHRDEAGVSVQTAAGSERFDQLVLACHSDQALRLVGDTASGRELAVLEAIRYQPNRAVLHHDPLLLPQRRAVWSAWNYASGAGEPEERPVSVSYLINRLQPLPVKTPVVVSLNPYVEPRPDYRIAEFEYDHPIFDRGAIAAQQRLPELQGRRRTWFCGAWTGYGFHEDGLKSALAVAAALGVRAPWLGHEAGEPVEERRAA
jgi:predicted NAD/FAD-binding protein